MSELVLIGGMPAGSKTTVAKKYTDKGYIRLNRDLVGGNVDDLLPKLDILLATGKNVVMDNLYTTKASRAGAIAVAKKNNIPVNFVLLDTSLEDAQFNLCIRMMQTCGRILSPEEHKNLIYRDNPNLFPVAVLYKYRKEFEKPVLSEGFSNISTEHFVRKYPDNWVNKGAIFDFDGTLRTHVGDEKYPTSPNQVQAFVDRKAKILEYARKGYILLGASNQSGIAKGTVTSENVMKCFDETLKQLDLHEDKNTDGHYFQEVLFCPHKVPPITCLCRKPGVGMLAELMFKYKLNPKETFYVGDMTTDKSCAARAGIQYFNHNDFFK